MRVQLFILLVFYLISGHAQYFELTPAGMQSKEGDYIVVNIDGSQADLYKKTRISLGSVYKNPDEVMSVVEPEIITINGSQNNQIRRNKSHVFDIDYSMVIRFKDNKIRFDAPSFKLTTFTDHLQTLHIQYEKFSIDGSHLGIYGKNDKLKSELAKSDLESFFNTIIGEIIKGLDSDSGW